MRILLQRVRWARVIVDDKVTGEIGPGLLALVGVGHGDDQGVSRDMARKVVGLRIFEDTQGKMNHDVTEAGGALLAVSQFTLFADCRKGRRPYFGGAAKGEEAPRQLDEFVSEVRALGVTCETGVFQAHMQVELCNDGPVTIWLEV